jgi:tetratricopeptide (TPR) repeat protein
MGLGAAYWRFWQMRGHLREGRTRLDAILAMPGARDHPAERLLALEAAGGVAYWQADLAPARAFYEECVAIARAGGDRRTIANAVYNLSFPLLVGHADLVGGLALLEEALALFRELHDEAGVARCLWGIGNELHFEKRYPDATVALDEAIGLFRALRETFSLGWALHTRALVAIKLKEPLVAQRFLSEGLHIFSDASDFSGIAVLLDDASSVANITGDVKRAFRLAGASAALQASSGAELASLVNVEEGRDWRDALTTDEQKLAWAEGLAMTVQQAVAYAREPESAAKATA